MTQSSKKQPIKYGGGCARGGQYLPVVDEEDAGVDLDPGVTRGQFGGWAPMGGNPPAIEETGLAPVPVRE